MPLGISRLLLSTSAIRRVFGTTPVIGDFEYLITQDGRTLQDQDFRFIAVEQSDIVTDEAITALFDALTTQDGRFFSLNQNPNLFLLLEQDFDTAGDSFISQAGDTIVTQDNRAILTQRES
jgi:hypothetical protein